MGSNSRAHFLTLLSNGQNEFEIVHAQSHVVQLVGVRQIDEKLDCIVSSSFVNACSSRC